MSQATKLFYPDKFTNPSGIYNGYSYNLPNFRAGLSKVKGGVSDCYIIGVGDSTEQGVNAAGTYASPSSNRGNGSRDVSGQLNTLFSNYFANAGISSSRENFFGVVYNTGFSFDARITSAGAGWYYTQSPGSGTPVLNGNSVPGNSFFENDTTTNPFVFTPLTAWDTVDVYFIGSPGTGTLKLQAGAQAQSSSISTTLTGSGSGYGVLTYAAPNSTPASQALSIVANGSTPVCLQGLIFRRRAVNEVRHINIGSSGSTSFTWTTSNAYSFLKSLPLASNGTITGGVAMYPSLAFLSLGINDAIQSTTPANFQASMSQIITTLQNNGTCDVVLVSPPPSGNQTASYYNLISQYISIYYQLSQQFNIPWLNTAQRWNSYATSNSSNIGYQTDNYHPCGEGYFDLAAQRMALINSVL